MQETESASRVELNAAALEQIHLIKNVYTPNPAVFYLLFLFAYRLFLRMFQRKSHKVQQNERKKCENQHLNFVNEMRKKLTELYWSNVFTHAHFLQRAPRATARQRAADPHTIYGLQAARDSLLFVFYCSVLLFVCFRSTRVQK